MVVTQDTYTHTLIGGNFSELFYVNVIQVVHSYWFLVCPIVGAVTYLDGDIAVFQLLYDFITENSTLFLPKFDTGFQLGLVSSPGMFRQGRKQEFYE